MSFFWDHDYGLPTGIEIFFRDGSDEDFHLFFPIHFMDQNIQGLL